MKIFKYVVAVLFLILTSLSIANAETTDRSTTADKVEAAHTEGMEIGHSEVGERPEVDHPEMIEVEHDNAHGSGAG